MTEIDLCHHVIKYFDGYEIFKEVYLAGRCDIVAKTGPIIVAIEAKLQFNINLIYQAYRHFEYCNYSFVAVPRLNKNYHNASEICKKLGIGVIFVQDSGHTGMHIDAAYRRKILKPILLEEHKLSTAGAQHNSMSAFKQTVRQLEHELKGGPVAMKDLFGKNNYHWSSPQSAQQCVCRYIRNGILKQFDYSDGNIFLKSS